MSKKNKPDDIFKDSSDVNILLLTDDACGDVLFVDDIYTALPGSIAQQQSRLAQIDEIRAGAGDDIIDMTSQHFVYDDDGVIIRDGDQDPATSCLKNGHCLHDHPDHFLQGGTFPNGQYQ